MKERGILFSAPMVRALLDGSKTQTRRAWTDQPPEGVSIAWVPGESTSRYGTPGDRLYVKETGWQRPERTARMMREGADTWPPYEYDADGILPADTEQFKEWGWKRRPSIFMPRQFSRIDLEIAAVRNERLHSISESDALAEGVLSWRAGWDEKTAALMHLNGPRAHRETNGAGVAKQLYMLLWDSINGVGSWSANPVVTVVSFRRLKP